MSIHWHWWRLAPFVAAFLWLEWHLWQKVIQAVTVVVNIEGWLYAPIYVIGPTIITAIGIMGFVKIIQEPRYLLLKER